MSPLLIALLTLGPLGLFLAMPGGRTNIARVGLVLLAAAAAALCALAVGLIGGGSTAGWFSGCALVALFAALRVITHKRPVYSALYFVLLIIAVTGLLLMMQAEFLAAALVIVYAGAILVTYIFVIMLAQQRPAATYDTRSREPFWGCLAGFIILAMITGRLLTDTAGMATAASAGDVTGTVEIVGARLLTHYAVAVQMVGLLLLAAMVGAIAIARRKPTPQSDDGELT